MSLHPRHQWYLTPKSCQSHNQGHKFPSWVTVLPIHLVKLYKCVQALSETQSLHSLPGHSWDRWQGHLELPSPYLIGNSSPALSTPAMPRKIQPSALSALLLWDGKGHGGPGPAWPWSSRGELAQSDALQHIWGWELSPQGCNSKLGKARALEEEGSEQLLWKSTISLRLIIYILFISYGTLTVSLVNIIW